MKTRANKLAKVIFMALLASTLLVSCGQNNSSGGGGGTVPVVPGGIPGAGFGAGSANLGVIEQENPCRTGVGGVPTGAARILTNLQIQGANVNVGSSYVGVTPEGDVAVISNVNGVATMQLSLCPRPDLTGNGRLNGQPVLNTSMLCPFGEITAANVSLDSSFGFPPYMLAFAPIHIPGTDRFSSLCRR